MQLLNYRLLAGDNINFVDIARKFAGVVAKQNRAVARPLHWRHARRQVQAGVMSPRACRKGGRVPRVYPRG